MVIQAVHSLTQKQELLLVRVSLQLVQNVDPFPRSASSTPKAGTCFLHSCKLEALRGCSPPFSQTGGELQSETDTVIMLTSFCVELPIKVLTT